MRERLVITGMGWVTPLGHELETVWRRLLAGDSGVSRTEHFDASTFPTNFSAQVLDYDWRPFVADPTLHEGIGRNIGYALGAASQAWQSSGLNQFDDSGRLDHDRVGIYLGSGEGVFDYASYSNAGLSAWKPEDREVDTVHWAKTIATMLDPVREREEEANMPLAHLAMEYDARGPSSNCLTACAASTQAIGEAGHLLLHGDADVMITGGAHTMIRPFGVTGFNRLTALSRRNDEPQRASRPFDAERNGFVMGEGAGIVILETLDHARKRGATPLAEIIGYGSTADAYRITDIHPEGRGAAQAMRQALDQAGIEPGEIDYISAHGTGTKENDSIESKAVQAVFCPDGPRDANGQFALPPMSSIKSMMGHLIAAAGSVELITAVLALRDQMLPPTINLDRPGPDCPLDYVPNHARRANVRTCMSNNFGFGGQNNTLIIREPSQAM